MAQRTPDAVDQCFVRDNRSRRVHRLRDPVWGAGANTAEQASGALEDQREQTHRLLDTHVEITNATHNESTLNVTVENTGSTRLVLGRTDFLVDGEYHQAEGLNASATATTVLHIGERMEFNLTVDDPELVTVVTEQGVADTDRVTNDTGGTPPSYEIHG